MNMQTRDLTTALFFLFCAACGSADDSTPEASSPGTHSQALTEGEAPSARTDLGPVKTDVPVGAAAAPKALSAAELKAVNEAYGPAKTSGFPTPAAAAAASLSTLSELVAVGSPEKRGFNSTEQAKSAAISNGLPVYFVRLDQLVALKAGSDEKALLFDKHQVVYPVSADGSIRSSVRVQQRPDGNWEAAQFGALETTKASQSALQRVSAARGVDTASFSLIEIPTVSALLLGHTEKGVLQVTPVFDVPGTSFVAGVTYSGAELFSVLSKLAAQVDPRVPN
jgi:hypothetical protein